MVQRLLLLAAIPATISSYPTLARRYSGFQSRGAIMFCPSTRDPSTAIPATSSSYPTFGHRYRGSGTWGYNVLSLYEGPKHTFDAFHNLQRELLTQAYI